MTLRSHFVLLRLMLSSIALLACSFGYAAEPSSIVRALQPFVDRHELAGAVALVASKERILSLEAVGYADIAAHKPMQTNALFWIASMSKPITATALMLLVDEGKVQLDDPVEKYLPQFTPRTMRVNADGARVRVEKPRHPILVRHLLSHKSGLPDLTSLDHPTIDMYPLAPKVQKMTEDQGGYKGNGGYGLGWVTHASGAYEHAGAYGTNMSIDSAHGVITVWLVQHKDFPGEGGKSLEVFKKAAVEHYTP